MPELNQKIDIIIPAYNAHDTLPRTLASILSQVIVDDLTVTIVDDASTNGGYSEIIEKFSPFMDIKEIKLDKNGGPGVARQCGIDNTNNPLFTFIDADDTFSGAFALKELRRQLEENEIYHTCVGTFVEENQENVYLSHPNDFVWVFGKLYKRSFIEKYNIHFNETRANEDNGFNTLIRLCSNDYEQIKFIPDVVYYWHMRPDSITRINNNEYSYNQSFVGYVDNMIYAIQEAKKRSPFNGYIDLWTVQTLCNLYEYYIETEARDPRFSDQNLECCRKFYWEAYKGIEDKITEQILAEQYSLVMRNSMDKLLGVIPCMSIHEFINEIGSRKYKEDIIEEPLKTAKKSTKKSSKSTSKTKAPKEYKGPINVVESINLTPTEEPKE